MAALTYPNKLSDDSLKIPCVVFNIKESRGDLEGDTTIVLPAPGGYKFDSSVEYNNQTLGMAEHTMVNNRAQIGTDISQAMSAMNGNNEPFVSATAAAVGGKIDKIKSALSNGGKGDVGKAGMAMAMAHIPGLKNTLNAIPGIEDSERLVRMTTQSMINKYVHTEFSAVGTRSFGFSFKFIADSQKDSNTIRDIWKKFQLGSYPSAPETTGGILLKYPPIWNIRFLVGGGSGKEIEHLPKIYEQCYLSSCAASFNDDAKNWYTPDPGNSDDCAPITCDLSLTFTEGRSLVAEDILKLQGG